MNKPNPINPRDRWPRWLRWFRRGAQQPQVRFGFALGKAEEKATVIADTQIFDWRTKS